MDRKMGRAIGKGFDHYGMERGHHQNDDNPFAFGGRDFMGHFGKNQMEHGK